MTGRILGPTATGTTPREQRLAAAGRLAAGLMHEFRNVLAPITNLAFILERNADQPEKVRELAGRLSQLAQVRGRVLDRLRDFLRQDAERFPDTAVLDLSAAACETVALCGTLAASNFGGAVTITCDAPAPLPVQGDGHDLRSAIFEMVLNALEAQSEGGTIRVRVWADDGRAYVEVADTGPGLPSGMAESAFDPFITSKEEPDAGLGLSAAWGIARRHGGDLTIASRATGGTTVVLAVPCLPSVGLGNTDHT